MKMMLCSRFPALTPFDIRRERAFDVFTLMVKYVKYNKREENKIKTVNGKRIIRKPAGDDWF